MTLLAICTITIVLCFIFLAGCRRGYTPTSRRQPATIADIAYDVNRRGDYRIFINENGSYVSYLVLTADYGGNVLLLREFLLDETVQFNPSPHGVGMWSWQDYGSYYPDSYIDNFLNANFMGMLGNAVHSVIVPSNIVVTDKSSIGVSGRASYTIARYVFLLSLRELAVSDPSTSVPEGEALKFFQGFHTVRVARFSSGMASPYWTRTPNNWDTATVFTIGPNASGTGSADVYSGVRPAFSVLRYTAITTSTDIISSQTVFVLDTGN